MAPKTVSLFSLNSNNRVSVKTKSMNSLANIGIAKNRNFQSSTRKNLSRKQDIIKGCLWNARSIKNKLHVIQDYRKDNNLDIMFLTECWLKDDDIAVIGELENNGEYKFISQPRLNRTGGGIGCLYKSDLEVKKLETAKTKTFEHLSLNLNNGGRNVTILIIYRSEPTNVNQYNLNDFFDEFTELISSHHCKDREMLIVGDFNFHMNKLNQPNARRLLEIFDIFELTQHVKKPTHVAGNILDLVVTRAEGDLIKSCVVDDLLSDHNAILMEIKAHKLTAPKKVVNFRKTRNINMAQFKTDLKNHLSAVDHCDPQGGPTYLDSLVRIYESCQDVLNKHAPMQKKEITTRNATPWNNSDIKEAKTAKRKAEKKWRKTRNQVDYEIFKEKRNFYNKTLNNLRSKYLSEKVNKCQGNSKALFKVVNSTLNRKPISPLPTHANDATLATEFSEFFEEKIENIRNKLQNNGNTSLNENSPFRGTPLMKFSEVDQETVRKLINRTATKHSELDPLPTWLVKECLDVLLPIITKIVNTSLKLGIMPVSYKHAIIKPLLKKTGLEPSLKNYRPISNLKFVSKIIEGVVIEQLNKHFNGNALQDPRQSAYKPNHSTETLLTKVHNDIMSNCNKNKITMLVMLDLSAAFDTIDHKILLNRLQNMYGIKNSSLDWFKSYLTGRTNAVTVNGSMSNNSNLKYGVPQGSKLGPILFNTYIAPMSNIAKSHNIDDQKYADDEQLMLAFSSTDKDAKKAKIQMEKCIDDIRQFLSNNKLCNNSGKTEIILFGSQSHLSATRIEKLIIDGTELNYSDEAKNLGVIFDKHMTMERQINKICKSVYFNIKNISHIRKCLNKNDTKAVVNALVTPHLDYGNSLLYGIPGKLLNKLQIAQNSAVRLIEKIGKREHITNKRKDLHWLPIEARIQYKLLLLTWKCIHNQAPDYLKDLISLRPSVRLLRSNDTNVLETSNNHVNSWGKRSFEISSPTLWNKLPESTRTIDTICTFKKHLKTHLFKLYYPER